MFIDGADAAAVYELDDALMIFVPSLLFRRLFRRRALMIPPADILPRISRAKDAATICHCYAGRAATSASPTAKFGITDELTRWLIILVLRMPPLAASLPIALAGDWLPISACFGHGQLLMSLRISSPATDTRIYFRAQRPPLRTPHRYLLSAAGALRRWRLRFELMGDRLLRTPRHIAI